MKKMTSLILTAAMLLLAACGRGTADPAANKAAGTGVVDDAQFVLSAPAEETPPDGGGSTAIAYAGDYNGISTGANMATWRGVQTFAGTFHYTATAYTAKADGTEAAVEALRQASESGAGIVVCNGDEMAKALYTLQGNYPTVSYLILDGEPHSDDYATYTTASNVHCDLFAEEQAGYLAGYLAVADGNRALGFVGSEQLPGIVRYATGFLQGAEAAAEDNGLEISLRTWYCATEEPNEQITAKIQAWYDDGMDLVLVSGGQLVQSVAAAAEAATGRLMTTDYDQIAVSSRSKGSLIKCYSRAAQQELYNFFAGGGSWSAEDAGYTETLGLTEDAVAMVTADWRMRNVTVEQYAAFYEEMRKNVLRVGRYSDMDTLPDTPNVAVYQDN